MPPDFFGKTTSGVEYGEVQCWISPAARRVLVKDRVHFLGQRGFMRWGRQVTGALPSGTEISKGINSQDSKSVFEVENTSGNSQSTSLSYSMAGGVQPGSCKSNEISRRWDGSRAQTRKNE